jgi:hypothetical protein
MVSPNHFTPWIVQTVEQMIENAASVMTIPPTIRPGAVRIGA